jgi:hypothetical protein
METAAISAFAAAAAALIAASVAGIQLYLGLRQSKVALIAAEAARKSAESTGRRRIAEFRQKWIDDVRDTLSEYQSLLILAALPRNSQEGTLTWDNNIRLHTLRLKLEMLLNPAEKATSELFNAIGGVMMTHGVPGKVDKSALVADAAQKILKAEWRRLQDELLQ